MTIPTLEELNERIQTNIETALSLDTVLLKRSPLRIIGTVLAGCSYLLYKFASWIYRQIFPATADSNNLERHCSTYGISRKPATFTEVTITVTGTDEVIIPSGTKWSTIDNIEFISEDDYEVASGSVIIPVKSVVTGLVSDVVVGQALSLSTPIAGVDSDTTVTAITSSGYDAETNESLLSRLHSRLQTPPQGGSSNDYVTWAKEVSGVTRAWCFSEYDGPSAPGITFMMDELSNPFPQSSDVAAVQAYIDDKRPVTAHPIVYSPTPVNVNFTLSITPSTVALKAAVESALEAFFFDKGSPGITLYKSQIGSVISGIPGVVDYTITTPSGNITVGYDEYAVLGTVSWS